MVSVNGKKYVSDVTLSIGMLSCIGDLYTLKVPNAGKDEELKLVCPACATNATQFPTQKYKCNDVDTHELFTVGDAARGRLSDDGKKMIIVTPEAVEAAKASVLPEKEFDLQVHMRDDVEAHTFDAGSAYVFKPSGKSKFYGVLVDLLKKRRDICFVAKTNMHKADHFVMVDVGLNDNLVIRDMIWPQDMKTFDTETVDYPKTLLAQAEMLIDASVEPFDVEQYRKESRERVSEAVLAAAGQKPAKGRKKPAAAPAALSEDDALAKALEAAIAAKKAS